MINISHKIRIYPNNKQRTLIHKSIGVARFAYNWGLDKWEELRQQGCRNVGSTLLLKEFNKVKREQFPWVMEVANTVYTHSLMNLDTAFANFRTIYASGNKKAFPKYHKRDGNNGSFYVDAAKIRISHNRYDLPFQMKRVSPASVVPAIPPSRHTYLQVVRIGSIRMAEELRFEGHILGITISRKGNYYYASFTMDITEEEYRRTHPALFRTPSTTEAVGIDLGCKTALTLSNGVQIHSPRPYKHNQRRLARLHRQQQRKQHPHSRNEVEQGIKQSHNYIKAARRNGALLSKIGRIRSDFSHKVTTALCANYHHIGLEHLNVKGMQQASHAMARTLDDIAMFELIDRIDHKQQQLRHSFSRVDRYYPSSRLCCECGHKKTNLKLSDRTYHCTNCGATIDRDLNAAINIARESQRIIGVGSTESTPADSEAVLRTLHANGITAEKIEAGRRYSLHINPPMPGGAGSDITDTASDIYQYRHDRDFYPYEGYIRSKQASKPSKSRIDSDYTKQEIEQIQDAEERERKQKARIDRNKKILRKTDRKADDPYFLAVLQQAATELHEWGILLTDAHVRACLRYGYTIPPDWVQPPLAERKRLQAIERNRKRREERARIREEKNRKLNKD